MDSKLGSHPANSRNSQNDRDLQPTDVLTTAAEGAEHIRVDWRLVIAYLAIAVAALLLI